MRKFVVVPVLMAVVLLLTISAARSSESEELRERAKMVKKEAAELAKAGRGDEAEKLARKGTELLEAAERMEGKHPKVPEQEIEKLHGHLKDLLDKGRRMKESGAPEKDLAEIQERIAKTKREIEHLHAAHQKHPEGHKGPGPSGRPTPEMMAKLEEAGRRIKHFRMAAENLHAAGADDLAGQLMEKAEIIEREAREAKMRITKEGEHHPKPEIGALPMQLEELRREVGRLRDEMNELRKHVKEFKQGVPAGIAR